MEENLSLVHQRQDGLYTVIIHPLNGQISSKDFEKVAVFIKENKNAEARLSMTESMYVRNLNEEQAKVLLKITDKFRQKTKIQQSMSCVGIPTCQIGIEQSQTLVKNILEYIKKIIFLKKIFHQYMFQDVKIHVEGIKLEIWDLQEERKE